MQLKAWILLNSNAALNSAFGYLPLMVRYLLLALLKSNRDNSKFNLPQDQLGEVLPVKINLMTLVVEDPKL